VPVGVSCLTRYFATGTIRDDANVLARLNRRVASALHTRAGGGTAARMTRRTPKG